MQQIFAALFVVVVFSGLLGLRYLLADRPAKKPRCYRAYLVKLTDDKDDRDDNNSLSDWPQELAINSLSSTVTTTECTGAYETGRHHFLLQEIA